MKSATLSTFDGLDVLDPAGHAGATRAMAGKPSLLARAAGALRAAADERKVRCQLLALDAHLLRDIGLSEDEVRWL